MCFAEETVDSDIMRDYPNLKALGKMIFDVPQINEYMKSRPKPDVSMLYIIPVST